MIYYTVYATINKKNGNFYIGFHKTEDPYDSYLGSGTVLDVAIKKHGKENFAKFLPKWRLEKVEVIRNGIINQEFSGYELQKNGIIVCKFGLDSLKELKELGLKPSFDQFYVIDGKPVIPKPWELALMTEENYYKRIEEYRKMEAKFFFGELK